MPQFGKEFQIDIFAVFELLDDSKKRFSLHIENKPPWGKFRNNQPESYNPRAIHKMNDPKWLNYSDFTTLLIAPNSFLLLPANRERCARCFDKGISYEDIGRFLPDFHSDIVSELSGERFQVVY